MSTHAIVAISDGINIRAIYVHFDGYPSHTGVILNAHYNSPDKINSLIDLGELSSIGPIAKSRELWSTGPDTDYCQAYGRDRGEKGTEPKKFTSLSDLIAYGKSYYAAYIYLFEDNRWVVKQINNDVWIPIKYAIKKDEN